jgi:hypothetical protein
MTEEDEMDDYLTIDLQSRDAVIHRLTVLRALVERSLLEATAIDEGATAELEERRFDLLAELLASEAAGAIVPDELAIFQTPIAQIPEEDEVAVILAAESFGALGRACGLFRDLPMPPDPVGSNEEILEQILMMSPEDLSARIVLPDEETAADLLEIAEVTYWRADVEFGARLNGGELTPEEKESIEAVGVEAQASGLLPVYPSGDLKLGNKPIRKWTDDEVETFYIVSLQQRLAIEWLCSAGQEWVVVSDEDEE